MSDFLVMPKGGLQSPDGKFTRATFTLLEAITSRVAVPPANSGQKVMAGGNGYITAGALWETMVPVPTAGGGDWQPDLTTVLDFARVLSGASTILFPNLPMDNALPFFSVLVVQNALGGNALAMGQGFVGQPPVILTSANDMTLLGFKVLSRNPNTFTGWAVKGIQAS